MKAIAVTGDRTLSIIDVEPPRPQQSEALVSVHAISLNRGEVRRALAAAEGHRPGWDFAGVVEGAAPDGSGPEAGTRVVGLMPTAGWAEVVAARTDMLATLPDNVPFNEAACLPIAGLTALHALARRGDLLSRKVLITGATGGVGHLACQLARLQGATVVAAVRTAGQSDFARQYGAEIVSVVGDDPARAAEYGPYDLILESVGGNSLSASVAMLAPHGVCVAFGVSGGPEAKIAIAPFYFAGGATIYGLAVFHELAHRERGSIGLSRLASLLSEKKLRVHTEREEPWTAVGQVARDLIERRYGGKAVLHLS